jgi:hypothetical protein
MLAFRVDGGVERADSFLQGCRISSEHSPRTEQCFEEIVRIAEVEADKTPEGAFGNIVLPG